MRVFLASPEELASCLAVRREVFIEEQAVAEVLEIDGLDPECIQVLITDKEKPVATARLRLTEDSWAKAERVAVLKSHRGQGLGHQLMQQLEQEAQKRKLAGVVLGAQVQVIPFYESRGYQAEGPEFMDAGIPHRTMRLRF